ncbi:MAG: gamma-glutamylcyclotransferase [Alphaproteobacteria bacterium]|nr:gamma-glutamylcyclotransferase [Alphaproteobacteria bacterium]
MKLDRDAIKRGVIDEMIRESQAAGFMEPRPEDERRELLEAALAAREAGAAVWVFGYGSLMWNPAFHYAEKRSGMIHGYHRSYCMWSPGGRGTPELPGLMLALDHGGACRGMAFRIAPEQVHEELDIIWSREMIGQAYEARWVPVKTQEGPVHALTFVINRDYIRYAGKVPRDVQAAHLATATGRMGSSMEYLENTVAHLDELGIGDGPMHDILKRARAYCSDPPQGRWENGKWRTTARKS